MSYPEIFIRCRLRAVHPFDGLADEIGLQLDRAEGGEPLRVTLCRAGALRLADQLRSYLAAPPSEDKEIDAVVSAPAALTDCVRALEKQPTEHPDLAALETAVNNLQTSVSFLFSEIISIRGGVIALKGRRP